MWINTVPPRGTSWLRRIRSVSPMPICLLPAENLPDAMTHLQMMRPFDASHIGGRHH